MFASCTGLTELDLSSFNTSNVTSMTYMFSGCTGLTKLDLSSFNTSNVTSMDYMFNRCTNLKTIYVGDNWSTSKVTNSTNMFYNCTSIVGGNGTTYSSSRTNKTYARVDKSGSPGYLTYKSS